MKTIGKTLGIIIVLTVTYSCSSVKVADSWKDIKTAEIKNKKVLVVNKTDDATTKNKFEKDMVNALNKEGYNAIESFVKFPDGKLISSLDKEEIKDILNCEGIDIVIMTSLQDMKEYSTTTITETSSRAYAFPVSYRRGYYTRFYRYYHPIYIDSGPVSEVTTSNKKYILETLIYDLTQPDKEELLSVIVTEIDNPTTLSVTSKDFAKKITKKLL